MKVIFFHLMEICSFAVLMAICSLMLEPNVDNPVSQEIADLCLKDPEQFRITAEEWTKTHAPISTPQHNV